MTITKRKISVGTLVLVALLIATALLPTVTSAYSVTGHSFDPWRGSWLASIYVYGKGETSTDFTSPSLRNTVYLWKYEGGAWVVKQSAVGTKSNANYLAVTVRHYHPSGGTFLTQTKHEWKLPGQASYYFGYSQSGSRNL
ncbi:MAG: hypothetical protein QUS33_00425 [Dehalococcoidia bacterium]|nr:hypothetical protein [Dehalococcoidia bacterium]